MTAEDPRVELGELTPYGEGARVAATLDAHRVIVRARADRCATPSDQVALFHLVNLLSRLFAHVDLDVDGRADWPSPLMPGGTLDERLASLRSLAPPAAADAHTELQLWWGAAPDGALCGDAAGWTYSLGGVAIPVAPGPPLGAVAATNLMAAQAFGRALGPLGMPFQQIDRLVGNLLDYRNAPAPATPGDARVGRSLLLGAGSLGSSAVYVGLLCGIPGGRVIAVDCDHVKARNALRYPALLAPTTAPKTQWLTALAAGSPLEVESHVGSVDSWLAAQPEPPAEPLALVSVDTPEGRRDATDVLARRTVNAGVAGMALHVAGHDFGDDGCAYCQYVDTRAALSGAALLGEAVGLPAERVIALHVNGGVLEQADIDAIARAGRLPGPPPQLGDRIDDLRRRIYAQAAVPGADGGRVLVSAPHVSAMAGTLMLAEAIKSSTPPLDPYILRGRFDLDMSGGPLGLVLSNRRDETRRCLCWSPFRRRAYARLHNVR